jgi:glutathione S-transferase
MFSYPLAGLVTVLTLFVYFWMATQVGKARRKHDIQAPAHSGPDEFNRVIRVFENTVEMMALFLPALWLFSLTISDFYAGIIGIFFPIGRVMFALGYYKASDKRGRGFTIGLLATLILLIGAALGTIHAAYAIYA